MAGAMVNDAGPVHASSHGLHAGHFAFMRAVVQGMNRRESWERYMQVGNTATVDHDIKQTIKAINNAYAAAANHYGRPGAGTSGLTRRLPLTAWALDAPVLSDFIGANNLDGFSEAEQIAAFHHQCGDLLQRQARREQLLARQLASLHWLQQHLQRSPAPGDLLTAWLAPNLARRLAAVHLVCVADLLAHIDRYGTRWAAGISAIGAGKARWISDWALAHRARLLMVSSGGATLWRHAQIVPLHKLPHPASCNEIHGNLRGRQSGCLIAAKTDVEAVLIWLAAKRCKYTSIKVTAIPVPGWELLADLSNTQRAYWKETERFLLWTCIERRITLDALTVPDCHAYHEFLAHLPTRWCGARGHDKNHPAWRPFEAAMSPAARIASVAIVRGMYRFLVQQGYLAQSPWEDVDRQSVAQPAPVARAKVCLGDKAWCVIETQLNNLAPTSANARLRVAIALLRCSCLSLKQVVGAKVEDLRMQPDAKTGAVHLTLVVGSAAAVILAPQVVDILRNYLQTRGLQIEFPRPANERAFLLGRAIDATERAPWAPCARTAIDPYAGIGIGTIRDQLRTFFQSCAVAAQTDAATALQLRHCDSRTLQSYKEYADEEASQ